MDSIIRQLIEKNREKIDQIFADLEKEKEKRKDQMLFEEEPLQIIRDTITIDYQWNTSDCQSDRMILIPTIIKVKHYGKKKGLRIVRFAFVFPPQNIGAFYFEVKIVKLKSEMSDSHCDFGIGIGFVTKNTPLCHQMPGKFPGTFAYFNDGHFYGQLAKENVFKVSFNSDAKFQIGDVVGCGIDLSSKQIIFTKNGVRLTSSPTFFVDSIDGLQPAVSFLNPGDEIEANFGPTFKFDFLIEKV
ncbi:hypothetical protein niasHS_009387 [Heterodera schachtii]|uniref:B30.2/SPRY domain-containing protein n=1 Tax=Heterodera schachtii TaxID=97005 RepID=A0ABD2JBV1_HETSC